MLFWLDFVLVLDGHSSDFGFVSSTSMVFFLPALCGCVWPLVDLLSWFFFLQIIVVLLFCSPQQ